MQARRRRQDLEPVAEQVPQPGAEQPVAGLVDLAHLADVAGQVALVDEAGQRGLRGQRGVPVGHELGRPHRRVQGRGGNHEAKAQRRQHGLGERADVDHPAAGVEGLQRLDRPVAVAELAVVVVLDDGGVVPLGPVEQGQPPGQRHRHAQRELM